MKTKVITSILLIIGINTIYSNAFAQRRVVFNLDKKSSKGCLAIHEGIVSRHKQTIVFKKGREIIGLVKLSEPISVVESGEPVEWGFYQFPCIYRFGKKDLVVTWQMTEDSLNPMNKRVLSGEKRKISRDGGKTWSFFDDKNASQVYKYNVKLPNGEFIVKESPTFDLKYIEGMPEKVCSRTINGLTYDFYLENELPELLRGTYFTSWRESGKEPRRIHARFNNSQGICRSATNSIMELYWRGDTRLMSDGSLVAGIYPTYHLGSDGIVFPSDVTFFKSSDAGHSWDVLGYIPYQPDLKADPHGNKRDFTGFTEPTFEELIDGTLLCVLRSTSGTPLPLYKSFSKDGGVTWSKPEAFTPNGVFPQLLRLNNSTLVLSSGRPGVQIRFCFEGDGKEWTEPVEMMPYMKGKKNFEQYVSCGYTSLLPINQNCFYIVYSEFDGVLDKSKWLKRVYVRRIEVY